MSIAHASVGRALSAPVLPGPLYNGVMALNPVAYYRMNDSYTTTMLDSSGNYRNGIFNGTGVAYRQPALITKDPTAKSVSFDGITGKATAGALPITDTFSIELWVHPLVVTGLVSLVSLGVGSGFIRFNNSLVEVGISHGAVIASSLITVAANSTIYTVFTKNGPNVHIWLYNGDQTGTVTNSTSAACSSVFIGADTDGINLLNGGIQEVAIYNYALSGGQIQANYNNGTG